MAAAGNDVDDELGVLPVVELVGVHIEGNAADLAELHVVAADAELGLGVAHRRRAVAAAARLVEHQGPVLGAQPLEELERLIRGQHPFNHGARIAQKTGS